MYVVSCDAGCDWLNVWPQERRSELESLDLAINLQREQLDTLKSNWRLKKGQRRHAGDSDTENEGRRAEIDHYMNVSWPLIGQL